VSAANAEFAFSGNYRSNRIGGRNSYCLGKEW